MFNKIKKFLRLENKVASWILIIIVGYSSYSLAHYLPGMFATRKAKQEVSTLFKSFNDGTINSHSFNRDVSNEKDDINKMLLIVKKHLVNLDDLSSLATIDEKEVENIFLVKNLCTKKGIKDANIFFDTYWDSLDKFEQGYNTEKNRVKAEILNAFSSSPARAKKYADKFDSGKSKSDEMINDYIMIERIVARKCIEIVDLFSENLGKVREENGNAIFKNKKETDRFNLLMAELAERMEYEDIIVDALQDHNNSVLQKWKNYDKT